MRDSQIRLWERNRREDVQKGMGFLNKESAEVTKRECRKRIPGEGWELETSRSFVTWVPLPYPARSVGSGQRT